MNVYHDSGAGRYGKKSTGNGGVSGDHAGDPRESGSGSVREDVGRDRESGKAKDLFRRAKAVAGVLGMTAAIWAAVLWRK